MPAQGTPQHVLKQLNHLKLAELKQLAVSLGTSCSGTKGALKESIEKSISGCRTAGRTRPLSVVSIDMGIRNLAYAHFTAGLDKQQDEKIAFNRYKRPRLCAWDKMAIAPAVAATVTSIEKTTLHNDDETSPPTRQRKKQTNVKAESFAPSLYATYAVALITRLITIHQPTHILIERQRFRSAGSPAVQDWTIRVGVLEGMLYAVVETLRERCSVDAHVEGVQPAMVNRFWTAKAVLVEHNGGEDASSTSPVGVVPRGKAMKNMKIDLAGRALEEAVKGEGSPTAGLNVDVKAQSMAGAYLSKWRKEDRIRSVSVTNGKNSDKIVPELNKLDDLADSLLQGMAWIEWENNRARLAASGDVEAVRSV